MAKSYNQLRAEAILTNMHNSHTPDLPWTPGEEWLRFLEKFAELVIEESRKRVTDMLRGQSVEPFDYEMMIGEAVHRLGVNPDAFRPQPSQLETPADRVAKRSK